ncbi:GAF and ANTAR domain-containing protein [Amycolatopsis dongchuanensis]|uniref:GAF and ANTAR domain-containing protein n=1 Tax=Amycolatopsis dongchuanensis TaxID=1070866 RepID=A0ABP9QIZ4_9PSEU
MGQPWEPDELGKTIAGVARDLLAQPTLQDTLDRIVHHAIRVVDGCEFAGILAIRGGEVESLAATDDGVVTSDRIQGELREGPCFDAARRVSEIYRLPDLAAARDRWPRYVPRALELGIGGMMSFLLYTDDTRENLGALDLYSSGPDAFTPRSEHTGWLLASHAAVAFAGARRQGQLHEAITTRQDIGEAIGILMERYKITRDQAFELLKKASQDRNVKLRELARSVTETGEAPLG